MPAQSTSATQGYAGGKRRTNLSLESDLAKIAMRYFPTTRHRSLSGFVENALRREFRLIAPKLRKAGCKLPATLFTK